MLMRHPQPFSNTARQPAAPPMGIQSNKNLESYHDPFDPTIGQRTDTFTPQQQRMSTVPFSRHAIKHHYFDAGMVSTVEALPPASYKPGAPPAYAAGLSSQEVRIQALRQEQPRMRPPGPRAASSAFPAA